MLWYILTAHSNISVDHRGAYGTTTGTGVTGGTTGTGATTGVGQTASSHVTPGSGASTTTAGPHDSPLLNKLDPRVDSDQDGSKTVGGTKTYT